jgi:hypothetical protein
MLDYLDTNYHIDRHVIWPSCQIMPSNWKDRTLEINTESVDSMCYDTKLIEVADVVPFPAPDIQNRAHTKSLD